MCDLDGGGYIARCAAPTFWSGCQGHLPARARYPVVQCIGERYLSTHRRCVGCPCIGLDRCS
jgi:hypothetical protein